MGMLRERYFATLGIEPEAPGDVHRLKGASDRAYSLRSFEIDLYWRRSAYFWGFQVAIFAAIGFIFQSHKIGGPNFLSLALSGLGILTAAANRFSTLGSKFWQKNWEKHIDMLEDEFEGRLHKTVWLESGGVYYSISRVNEQLTTGFIWFRMFVFALSSFTVFSDSDMYIQRTEKSFPVITAVKLAIIYCVVTLYNNLKRQLTELRGTFPKQDGSPGEGAYELELPKKGKDSRVTQIFVRRRSRDE